MTMEYLNRFINAIRSNPLTAICAVIILISLGSYYWTHTRRSTFCATMNTAQNRLNKINRSFSQSVDIPPPNPDDPPTKVTMVINKAAINRLETIYRDMDDEYKRIYDAAINHNQKDHNVMLDGVFPTPIDQAKPYNARAKYLKSFGILYQQINAGTVPTKKRINDLLESEEKDMCQRLLLLPGVTLTDKQKAELLQIQSKKLMKLYMRIARNYHIYADPVALELRGHDPKWEPGPFNVGQWARSGRPSVKNLWEGQMQLWIQQNLIHAIIIANQIYNADNTLNKNTSIITAPVKRLVSIIVTPGYIGVPAVKAATAPVSGQTNNEMEAEEAEEIKQRMKDYFFNSPTGRRSNSLYDIRHVKLTAVVDTKKIPELLNAIGKVNFTTVIGLEMTDIDEYEQMRAGYFYGNKVDAVQVTLTIETIWLRRWLAGHVSPKTAAAKNEKFNPGLMPDDVRYSLGLKPRNSNYVPPTN